MELSYPLRLACLVVASIGLLQTVFELLLWCCGPLVLRMLRRLPLRQQERTLYGLQLAPLLLALGVTTCLWVPHYVSNETNFEAEGVGWVCLLVTALFAIWWGYRVFCGVRMLIRTMSFSRECRLHGVGVATSTGETPIVAIEGTALRAGLVGFGRPFIFISRSLLEGSLNPTALSIVFDHERSHARQRDNWKLLSLHCLPRVSLRFSSGKTWMQLWQNAAEWAADEDAVQGNRAHALLLAETLVAMARSTSVARSSLACTYFVCGHSELAARVEHLIDGSSNAATVSSSRVGVAFLLGAIGSLVVLANVASALHDLPERLLHLG